MGSVISALTAVMADRLCEGSSRKLIAGLWYSIITASLVLVLLSFWMTSTRKFSESFLSMWSALLVVTLSVGGTMIMRSFHHSIAVGFFLGSIVAMAQLFFVLSFIYFGYAKDRKNSELPSGQESFNALICLIQSILLGTFAAILGAHRSEILEDHGGSVDGDESTLDQSYDRL